ncbi:hypothetical protein N9W42_01475 [Pseudomonadales bacterium]|nr:hypothetical protein [Pseudomonadales bacterium]
MREAFVFTLHEASILLDPLKIIPKVNMQLEQSSDSMQGCIWLVKMEEDLPIDESPFPHRMTVIAEILSERYRVIRYASQLNHKNKKNRSLIGKKHISANYSLHIIKSLFNYKESKVLRLLHIYLSALQLLLAFVSSNEKPMLIICSMPSPVNCFVAAFFKKVFSKKTKLILDSRDLWPDIFNDEVGASLHTKIVSTIMRRELIFAVRQADGLMGISDYFSTSLLRYTEESKITQTFYLLPSAADASNGGSDLSFLDIDIDIDGKVVFVFGGTISKTTFNELARFIELFPENERFILLVCGHGYYYNDLINLPIKQNIKILGHLSYEKFTSIKSVASYGVVCVEDRVDYRNSLSNKFFDYLYSGLPIITNLDGLVGQVVRENRIGFVYQSDIELQELLLSTELSSPREIARLKHNVQDCCSNGFSRKMNIENIQKFISCVLSIDDETQLN